MMTMNENFSFSRLALVIALIGLLDLESIKAFSPTSTSAKFGRISSSNSLASRLHYIDGTSSWNLYMQQSTGATDENPRQGSSDLSAFSSEMMPMENSEYSSTVIPDTSFLENFIVPVMSASFLITGNTVGAGMLVLPDLAAGSGMALSTSVLVGAYMMNLVSGLAIAQVAIEQHESSGSEVPSSFKEFAEANLPAASNLVSGVSIFINTLVLAFNTAKGGQLGSAISGLDDHLVTYVWAAALAALVSTCSLSSLSSFASILVMGLFASIAGLLLPGLAQVPDPLAVLSTPPEASLDIMSSVLHMTPVIITTLVYQNIVPTVTRILDYDRTKTTAAITLGSMTPLALYTAWCVAVVGGGIDTDVVGLGGPLMTIFSMVTVIGSSMGALMSLSEEFEIMLGQDKKDTFSMPSVALPVGVSLLCGQLFASDINGALKVAGSYGSPLLYGLIPVAMVVAQQQNKRTDVVKAPSVVPGGLPGLSVLGLGATGLIGCELVEACGQML